MPNYSIWFAAITQKHPFPYQERLATAPELPILLNVPTGVGKTAAAVLRAWFKKGGFKVTVARQIRPSLRG